LHSEDLAEIAAFNRKSMLSWDHNELLAFADGTSAKIASVMGITAEYAKSLQTKCRRRAQKMLNDDRRKAVEALNP
jgi:predicted PilT family ATPase